MSWSYPLQNLKLPAAREIQQISRQKVKSLCQFIPLLKKYSRTTFLIYLYNYCAKRQLCYWNAWSGGTLILLSILRKGTDLVINHHLDTSQRRKSKLNKGSSQSIFIQTFCLKKIIFLSNSNYSRVQVSTITETTKRKVKWQNNRAKGKISQYGCLTFWEHQ